jgi:hypothetical protein
MHTKRVFINTSIANSHALTINATGLAILNHAITTDNRLTDAVSVNRKRKQSDYSAYYEFRHKDTPMIKKSP